MGIMKGFVSASKAEKSFNNALDIYQTLRHDLTP